MKRFFLPLLIGFFFLTLQTTLLTPLSIQRVRPDLLLVLTLYLGIYYPPISGCLLTFLIGFLMDLFSGNSFGLYTFTRPFIFYLTQLFKDRFYLQGFSSQFLFVFLSALFEGLLTLLLIAVLNPNPLGHLYPLFFTFLLPQSFITGLVTPVLFSLFNKGFSFLFNRNGTGIKERG